MNDLPRISLVTPSYNQARYLDATIRSVLEQGYPNLQYGVIDGASTDGSDAIIAGYRDRLDYAILEPDRGQVDAINKGLLRMDGQVVGFLNSDDTLLPGALDTVGRFFAEHPQVDWAVGNCIFIDSDGQPTTEPHSGRRRMEATAVHDLAHALLRDRRFELPQPSVFFRRDLLDRHGLFDEALQYTFDFDMWCRFLAAGHRCERIDADLSTYRLHDASKSCALAHRMVHDRLSVEVKYAPLLPAAQQRKLRRLIGYRRRQLVVATATARPWTQVLRRPWWLGSQQIRQLLIYGPQQPAMG